ncbi:hypothetical protein K492DRAFT_200509 [Lichtheimia hyalospora FSU 10163]|nr:hypothetical protein K492DRAFT_200509 [Lichtheimia hyalospora FSU 10163]
MKQQQNNVHGLDIQFFQAKNEVEQFAKDQEGLARLYYYWLLVKDVIVSICIA